jgi:hypothetical protein
MSQPRCKQMHAVGPPLSYPLAAQEDGMAAPTVGRIFSYRMQAKVGVLPQLHV